MRPLLLLLLSSLLFLQAYSQQDTVRSKHGKHRKAERLNSAPNIPPVPSDERGYVLKGTTILPNTQNQMEVMGYGLDFDGLSKTDCSKPGEEEIHNPDKINYIINTDSTLVVDITFYDNCCYEFLCDVKVDSNGTLILIHQGYGSVCGCHCCFGLTYYFSKTKDPAYSEIKAVMLEGNPKAIKKIE